MTDPNRFRDPNEIEGTDFGGVGEDRETGHETPREEPWGEGFDRPEPGRLLEHRHERRYTGPYDRWEPNDYVFYYGEGYHREFIEPFKVTGPFSGRGPRNYRRPDARIEEDVVAALTVDADLDATEVRVRVDGGEVTLEGSVPDRASKRRAEDIAGSIRGVLDTHNRLRVGPPGRAIEIGRRDDEDAVRMAPSTSEFEALGGGSPPHYDRKAEQTEAPKKR